MTEKIKYGAFPLETEKYTLIRLNTLMNDGGTSRSYRTLLSDPVVL